MRTKKKINVFKKYNKKRSLEQLNECYRQLEKHTAIFAKFTDIQTKKEFGDGFMYGISICRAILRILFLDEELIDKYVKETRPYIKLARKVITGTIYK